MPRECQEKNQEKSREIKAPRRCEIGINDQCQFAQTQGERRESGSEKKKAANASRWHLRNHKIIGDGGRCLVVGREKKLKECRLRKDTIFDIVFSVNRQDGARADKLALEGAGLFALVLDAHVDLGIFASSTEPCRFL